MQKIIHNEAEKEAFIHVIQNTEIKSDYRAEFVKIVRKRSLSANNYFWLCITIGSQETGNNKMDLYYYFLDKFPTHKEVEISDVLYSIPISSSAFNTGQMARLTDDVRRELMMMGITTPDVEDERALDAYYFYKDKGLI